MHPPSSQPTRLSAANTTVGRHRKGVRGGNKPKWRATTYLHQGGRSKIRSQEPSINPSIGRPLALVPQGYPIKALTHHCKGTWLVIKLISDYVRQVKISDFIRKFKISISICHLNLVGHFKSTGKLKAFLFI